MKAKLSSQTAFSFYSIGIISFLESAVPNYVESLDNYFHDNVEALQWLHNTWLPEEAYHGVLAREFLQEQWPDFDWQSAYAEFLNSYAPLCNQEYLRPTKALESLARCVTETQAAMIYRCIVSYTNIPELKSILNRMSEDEIRHYTYFRDLFDHYDAFENNSFLSKIMTIITRSELVREEDLALAYKPLNTYWKSSVPFRRLSYNQYLYMASMVMKEHFPFQSAQRMLFRPLKTGHFIDNIVCGILVTLIKRQYRLTLALS